MQKPIKQEVNEWKEHKVTKYLIKELKKDRAVLQEMWAAGQFTMQDTDGTIQMNSRSIGQVAAIDATLEFVDGDMDAEEGVVYDH